MATRKQSKPTRNAKISAKSRARAKKPSSTTPAAIKDKTKAPEPAKELRNGGPDLEAAPRADESVATDEDALPLDILGEMDTTELDSQPPVSNESGRVEPGEEGEATEEESETATGSSLTDSEEIEDEPVSGPTFAEHERLFSDSDLLPGASDGASVVAMDGDLLDDDGGVKDTGRLLRNAIEAMLFVSEKPVTIKEIAKGLQLDKKRAQELLEELRSEFAGHGVRIDEVAEGYAFRTHPSVAEYVRSFLEQRPVKLSRAQLETLAIVAYRQPITRPEVDDIRGVDCGPVLKGLLDRDLVRIIGKKDEPGRPMLYGTTPAFLELFGLKSLQELPTLREFAELSEDSKRKYEEKMGEGAPLGLADFGLQAEGDEPATPEAADGRESSAEEISSNDTAAASNADDKVNAARQVRSEDEEDEGEKDDEDEDEEDDEDEDEEDDEDENDEDDEDEDEEDDEDEDFEEEDEGDEDFEDGEDEDEEDDEEDED